MKPLGKVNLQAKQIKLVIFDVDGVLTDGGLYFSDEGVEFKRFNSLDGFGIKMLKQNGIESAIISARNTKSIEYRMKNLGIKHFYQGQSDKLITFYELLDKCSLNPNQVAYVGDDIIDLPVICKVGLPIAVANADELVKEYALMVTEKNGGYGAVRQVCDFILKAQNKYNDAISMYLEANKSVSNVTDFQSLCYHTLKTKVLAGSVISYVGLAKLIGNPKASRAVGLAMNKNPFVPEVPCHRVVNSDGGLGGFASDPSVKIKRLQAEGVMVKNGKIVNFEQVLYKP